jgi:penicillin-binding protein 1A
VEIGTLASGSGWGSKFTFKDEQGNRYRIPAAGKTGTTQNWSDAWAIGYTPYYTSAIWFGFDKPGNSLGLALTGATLAGTVWGDFMREIHQGLPMKDFVKPSSGIVDVTVCAKSGLLRTPACNEGSVSLPFLEGTQPAQYCTLHGEKTIFTSDISLQSMRSGIVGFNDEALTSKLKMPTLQLDFLSNTDPNNAGALNTDENSWFESESFSEPNYGPELPVYNPLLD